MQTNIIQNKVGIITGGAGRLGQTFAKALAAHNQVILIDLPQDCGLKHKNVHYFCLDISDEKVLFETVAKIHLQFGRIDFLVNNAALQITKPLEMMSVAEFKKSIDVNLVSAYAFVKAVMPAMMQQKSGSIVNLGSIYGVVSADPSLYGNSGLNSPDAYAASKGGLIHLTKYLAVHLAKYGIRVNAISPAGVADNQPAEFKEKYLKKVPLGRMLEREELVGPLQFLLSEASSYVTGHNLMVDGGFTAW